MTEELFNNKYRLGMLLFLSSEGIFFAFLITAYVFYHGSVIDGPNAHANLDVWKTGIYTIVLLLSKWDHPSCSAGAQEAKEGFWVVAVSHNHLWPRFFVWRNARVHAAAAQQRDGQPKSFWQYLLHGHRFSRFARQRGSGLALHPAGTVISRRYPQG